MKIKLLDGAYVPERAHPTDAGLDLKSCETKWVHPNSQAIFDTKVCIEVPHGCVGLLTSKSGLMSKGLTSRGTIDVGYTGSIKVILYNHTNDAYLVHEGDKVSQLVVIPILFPEIEIVQELGDTDRGNGGFGSTGR